MALNELASVNCDLSRYRQQLGFLLALRQDARINGQTLESMITDIQGIIYKLEDQKRKLEAELEW